MAVSPSTGCKLYLGTNTTALASESAFIEIGEVQDLGEFGDLKNIIRFISLSDSRVRKTPGSRDAGDITLTVGYDSTNAGQDDMRDAADYTGSQPYNVKIELNDALTTSGTPTTFTFQAHVLGFRTRVGAADNTVLGTTTLAITSGVTTVSAT